MYLENKIDVKKAIEIAMDYLKEVYSNSFFFFSNVILEEIERQEYNNHGDCWFITIGFDENDNRNKGLASAIDDIISPSTPKRKYKTIIIDADGNVPAMKIREAEVAF